MKSLFILALLVPPFLMKAQYEDLQLLSPNGPWPIDGVSIDSMVLEVSTSCGYAEIEMYFNFSSQDTPVSPDDSLEIQMTFQLPPYSEVTDMWLWVGDSIVKAGIYDIWSASQVYEDIVERRVDPAILYKLKIDEPSWNEWGEYWQYVTIPDHYMFKIFPLLTNLPRKAKITYLTPLTDPLSTTHRIPLPLNILKLSKTDIPSCKIVYVSEEGGEIAPILEENPNLTFLQNDQSFTAALDNPEQYHTLTLRLEDTASEPVITNTYIDPETGTQYYGLISNQEILLGSPPLVYKKALIMFDFVDANSSLNGDMLLAELKQYLHQYFNDTDSINMIISGVVTQSIASEWLPADSLSIESIFSTLESSDLNSGSNLQLLFFDGINFIQDHGGSGDMVLVSSSNDMHSVPSTNNLWGHISSLMGQNNFAVHILDLDNVHSSGESFVVDDKIFRGNQYFNHVLSSQTGGVYLKLYDHPIPLMLELLDIELSKVLRSFELYVSREDGFTYSNHHLCPPYEDLSLQSPLNLFGKCTGTGPFTVTSVTEFDSGDLLQSELTIEPFQIESGRPEPKTLWAAANIRHLSNLNQTNQNINDMIEVSTSHRVLSPYTAFLALEPGVGPINPVVNLINQISVQGERKGGMVEITNYPNPFSDHTNIEFTLPCRASVEIRVMDLYGREIYQFNERNAKAGKHSLEFRHDGLPDGVYLCRLTVDDYDVHIIRMVMMN